MSFVGETGKKLQECVFNADFRDSGYEDETNSTLDNGTVKDNPSVLPQA